MVPGDHFQPGEWIVVSGSELTEGSEVILRLQSGTTIVELTRAQIDPDATLAATAMIPPSFPLGYAELTASDESGNVWSTIVLVGDRPEGPGDRPGGGAIDERTIWLLVLGGGLVIFVGAGLAYVRGRPDGSTAGG